jgi:hypothetical protein
VHLRVGSEIVDSQRMHPSRLERICIWESRRRRFLELAVETNVNGELIGSKIELPHGVPRGELA